MTKKKIHIYTQYYFPISNACSNRVEKYILALKHNYDISVITGMPNYPTGIKNTEYKYKLFKREIGRFGENIIRTYELATKNEGSILRLLNYFSFMISSSIYGLFSQKPEKIIVTSPPLFTALSVLFLYKIRKIPYILEVRDLWPESVVALGYMKKKSLGYKLFSRLEKSLYQNADQIIGVTQGICSYIKELGIDNKKINLQYNVSKKLIGNNLQNPYLNLSEKISGKKIFLFAGNINEAYDFESAVIKIKEKSNLFFVFIGDGSMKNYLIEKTNGFNNILFLNRVSYKEVQNYIYYSQGIFIPLQNNDFFKGTFPVKGIEALVNNKEILFIGPEGEFSSCLEKYNKGEFKSEIMTYEYFQKHINGLIK